MPQFPLALLIVTHCFACLSFACSSFAAEPPITSVTFSPDGKSVVACSQAGVTVYSWPGLKQLAQLDTSSPNIHDCAFSPSGDRLAVAGGTPAEDGTVEIFSWPKGQSLRVLNGHFDSVMAARWLDETTLASAGLDHHVLIWNVQKGKITRTLKGHSRGVLTLGFLAGQNMLVSAGTDQSLRIWKTDSGDLVRSMAIHTKPVSSVSLRPANEGLPMIASASDDRTVRFWQPTIGRLVRFTRLPSQPRAINWLPDGSRVVACCNDGRLYVINPDTVAITADIHATEDWAYAIAVHPNDGTIAVAGSDGAIKRIDVSYGALFMQYDTNGDGRLSSDEVGNDTAFGHMDANGNGYVTEREAIRFAQRRTAQDASARSGKPVFPADPDSVAAKQKTLDKIKNVDDRDNPPPNVVLILADDLGYADTSIYGSKAIPTPHIDALATSGVKLTDAYVTAASCSPSRAGLMAGRYQQRFGFEFNTAGASITHRLHRGLDPAAVILADVMQAAGYTTGMFGKWHLGTQPQFHPLARGFDEFYGFLGGAHSFFTAKADEPIYSTIMRGNDPLTEPEYLTDAIARETERFIDKHAEKPFFAYVPFNAVHTPIEATKKYQDRFPGVKNETRRDYYAMTSALDDAVGRIIDAVQRNQLTDKTFVIFLNDNGGPIYTGVQSNAPLKLGKLFLFEGGIRVPMLMKWPGILPAGEIFDRTTSSLDVFPTVCAAAGIKLPSEMALDGVDLTPFLTGKNDAAPHETLFWSNGPNKAVRHGHWKLVKSGDSKWLYDLATDIGETKNLVESNPERLVELEALLEDWQKNVSPPAWPSKPQRRKVDVDGGTYEMNI